MKNWSIVIILFFMLIISGMMGCNTQDDSRNYILENLAGSPDTRAMSTDCPGDTNCIPEELRDDWRLNYKPYYGDCMKCHTRCTHTVKSDASNTHNFCTQGGPWNRDEAQCRSCHTTVRYHE